MANMLQLGLRGAEFLFTFLIMALVGNMIAETRGGSPSLINFDMFVVVFAMLSLFYLIAITFKEQFTFHKFVPAGLDLLNAVLFFIAAIAMSAELGAHSCSNRDWTRSNRITNGSNNTGSRCREAQAVTAFLWFNFALFLFSLFLTLTSSGGVNMRGPRRGPTMSQV